MKRLQCFYNSKALKRYFLIYRQARSQGGCRGCNAPPQICQKDHFMPQSGPKWGFFRRVKGVRFKKSTFLSPKGLLSGGFTPPQNQSWLRSCLQNNWSKNKQNLTMATLIFRGVKSLTLVVWSSMLSEDIFFNRRISFTFRKIKFNH